MARLKSKIAPRRRRTAGVALTEAIITFPITILLLKGMFYFFFGYDARLNAIGKAQFEAFSKAHANDGVCQGDVSETDPKQLIHGQIAVETTKVGHAMIGAYGQPTLNAVVRVDCNAWTTPSDDENTLGKETILANAKKLVDSTK